VALGPATGQALFDVESLAGYMTTDKGRRLVFGLSMSGGTFPGLVTGVYEASDDVAMVAA
jgi:D-alanyl-D-alanine carboxypeptidase/D-alanyl-D-alanine-endopeptidase (penicillin-binding protein 4)